MIVYHFCYDLNYFKIIAFDFYHHPMWLIFRGLIVTLFIGIAGISLHLATTHGVNRYKILKRLIILTGCAVLISVVSFVLFNKRFIFFGILHFMVIANLLGLLFTRWFWLKLIGGTGILIIGLYVQHPFFNQPLLQWVGLMTYKPSTEDYVPLLPWFGIMLLGMFIGQGLHYYKPDYLYYPVQSPWIRRLAGVGQHSLLIYMVHQPVLIGGLFVWSVI
jgi:uncharacterized membrane protein